MKIVKFMSISLIRVPEPYDNSNLMSACAFTNYMTVYDVSDLRVLNRN